RRAHTGHVRDGLEIEFAPNSVHSAKSGTTRAAAGPVGHRDEVCSHLFKSRYGFAEKRFLCLGRFRRKEFEGDDRFGMGIELGDTQDGSSFYLRSSEDSSFPVCFTAQE